MNISQNPYQSVSHNLSDYVRVSNPTNTTVSNSSTNQSVPIVDNTSIIQPQSVEIQPQQISPQSTLPISSVKQLSTQSIFELQQLMDTSKGGITPQKSNQIIDSYNSNISPKDTPLNVIQPNVSSINTPTVTTNGYVESPQPTVMETIQKDLSIKSDVVTPLTSNPTTVTSSTKSIEETLKDMGVILSEGYDQRPTNEGDGIIF